MEVKMRKVSLEQTQKFKNSDKCIATEYGFADKEIDITLAEINGRYPEKDYCVNEKVKEMILCLEGTGKLCKENETISFKVGDAVLIDKGEKFYWDGHCKVAMHCAPAWYPDQHKLVK